MTRFFSGPDVPCVVCGTPVARRYERHRYCSLRCWSADPANARHAKEEERRDYEAALEKAKERLQ